MNADPLTTTVIDLVRAINRADFRLILGGGFGLYLKQLHLQQQVGLRTLLSGDLWPYPRATDDLDVFLPTEVVVSLADMQALRAALDHLDFRPVEEAKFLHFVKSWGDRGRVKIDMLTGPIFDDSRKAKVQFTQPRVRPRAGRRVQVRETRERFAIGANARRLTYRVLGAL